MGLITCPECKKKVSEKAKSCPNCGYPLEKLTTETNKKQEPGCLATVLTLLIFALFLHFCDSIMNETKVKQTSHSQKLYASVPLNVREAPSKNSKKIYVLSKGTKVKIIETKGNWSKIVFEKNDKKIAGWVYNKFLSPTVPKRNSSATKKSVAKKIKKETRSKELIKCDIIYTPSPLDSDCVKECYRYLSSLNEEFYDSWVENVCREASYKLASSLGDGTYEACALAGATIGAARFSKKKIPLDVCLKISEISRNFCQAFYCSIKH